MANAANVRSLSCPNCGGTVQLRGMGRSLSVVCINCLSVLDARTPSLTVLSQFQAKERYQPLLPLGTRGKVRGDLYEAIGFQVRELVSDGVAYAWSEYLLFNPYKGYRYLTEYNGHWNDVLVLHTVPEVKDSRNVRHFNETYKHFQTYTATTIFVMGEFPWQVRVGESAQCADYIHPPRLLSMERTGQETTWSLGEYTAGADIWKNFGLKGSPPAAQGVFANQPSPHSGSVSQAWRRYALWMALLIAMQFFWAIVHSGKTVFDQKFSYTQQSGTSAENSFVTSVFDLPGRTSTVKVEIRTDLDNEWAFFQLALLNADTGEAYDFSREVSYYQGRDSDGNWSEGSRSKSVTLGSVPAGRYYLRIEPEFDTSTPALRPRSMNYQVRVKRDVTTWIYFVFGAILLLIPPVWTSIRIGSFEGQRWSESDYAGGD